MHRDYGVFSELDALSTGFNALQFGYQTKTQNTLNNLTLRRSWLMVRVGFRSV